MYNYNQTKQLLVQVTYIGQRKAGRAFRILGLVWRVIINLLV